jgi:hypothetical protein
MYSFAFSLAIYSSNRMKIINTKLAFVASFFSNLNSSMPHIGCLKNTRRFVFKIYLLYSNLCHFVPTLLQEFLSWLMTRDLSLSYFLKGGFIHILLGQKCFQVPLFPDLSRSNAKFSSPVPKGK